MRTGRLFVLLFLVCVILTGGGGASAEVSSKDYTLNIPPDVLARIDARWTNIPEGISASSDKNIKITITAVSSNDFALVSEHGERLSYILTSRDGGEKITSWEFTPEELNKAGGTVKPLGVLVADMESARPGSYWDSLQYRVSADEVITVGDKVTFGRYTYSGATYDLVWTILEVSNGIVLLLCNNCVDSKQFDTNTTSQSQGWKSCTLRTWLTGEFLNGFTDDEKNNISTVMIDNNNEAVYLLSDGEVNSYFPDKSSAVCKMLGGTDNVQWWLRSPVNTQGMNTNGSTVNTTGDVVTVNVTNSCAVRPALWMKL